MHKYWKVRAHDPQNFAKISELPAEVPVLTEVKEYFLLRHPPNLSKNQKINEPNLAPHPRSAGGEGTGPPGRLLLKDAIWEILSRVQPKHIFAAESNV